MNDKPVVQFKLTVPDTDSLRAMIARDYAATLAEVSRLATPEQRNAAPEGAWSDVQRRMTHGERLADIFSVTLPKK
jgi:hypothetical protein